MVQYIDTPKLLLPNQANECVLTSTHGGTTSYLVDGYTDLSTWQSTGAADDDTAVSLTFDRGAFSLSVNFIAILNHNFKDLLIEYYDYDEQWHTFLTYDNVALLNDRPDLIIDFADLLGYPDYSELGGTKLRFTVSKTQIPDTDKYCSEIFFSRRIMSLDKLQSFSVKPRQRIKQLSFADNSMQQVVQLFGPWNNKSQKYESSVQFTQLTQAQLDTLKYWKEVAYPMTWWPEPNANPRNFYAVHWTNPLAYKYTTQYKGNGYDVTMELKEI